ncbi:hypothetical protein P3T76_015772 [Phytophthora citrophthora]|uniref:MULE transposase domain-containing protein n=2 Tax=Phytophthora citrophthora TaxID=4793 RepID=A0AAD9FYM2_9STRA|nr:hypothetical protein P3T76_015772 [Phytophthora citrophthora]
MKRMTDKLTTENPGMTENEIWGLVCAQFYGEDRDELVDGLTEEQVIGRVRRARRRYYGGNIHGVVEVPPFSKVTDSAIPFFRFHFSSAFSKVTDSAIPFFRFHFVSAHQNPKKPAERILGWAHPALKELLFYDSISLFVDGTFRCVPRGFHQCLILMVDDPARNMFTPVYFVLCTSRTETTYSDILHLISRDTEKKMTPAEIVCDFEFGLISAVQQAFPNAEVVGCFFHFKQALHRRMKFEHITEKEILIAMTPGCLDILTVIDPQFIDPKGIAWVKLEIKGRCATKGCAYSTRQWRNFWRYFHRIWLRKYSVSEWNVFGIANTIVARTNNPLERFNREMNAAFKPHPSLRHFVATIAKMSTEYARKMSNITRGLRQKKKRLPRIDLPMSPDFDAFEVPAESDVEDEVSSDSDEFKESICSSSDVDDTLDSNSDDDLPSGEVVVESLEPETEQHAVGYDFSLDYSGSEDYGEETSDN